MTDSSTVKDDLRVLERVSPAAISAGFRVLSYQYDPDAPEADRRRTIRDAYLAMRKAQLEGSGDLD